MTTPNEHPLATLRLEHSPRYLTAAALATAAGVAASTVARAERGHPLGYLAATKVARALGLTVDELASKVGDQIRTIDSPTERVA